MGGAACAAIIIDGNVAYATIEQFSSKHPQISTEFLSAAVLASCNGINYASLYFNIEGEEDKLTEEYTKPIINLHNRIIDELPLVENRNAENLVNELTSQLMSAIRRVEGLFN